MAADGWHRPRTLPPPRAAGTGGMSEVWRAEDQTLHRHRGRQGHPRPDRRRPHLRERFLREAPPRRRPRAPEHPRRLRLRDPDRSTGRSSRTSSCRSSPGGSLKEQDHGARFRPARRGRLARRHRAGPRPRAREGHSPPRRQARERPSRHRRAAAPRRLRPRAHAGFGLGPHRHGHRPRDAVVHGARNRRSGRPSTDGPTSTPLAVIAFELPDGARPVHGAIALPAVLHQHVSTPPEPMSSVLAGSPPAVDPVMAGASRRTRRPLPVLRRLRRGAGGRARRLPPRTPSGRPAGVAVRRCSRPRRSAPPSLRAGLGRGKAGGADGCDARREGRSPPRCSSSAREGDLAAPFARRRRRGRRPLRGRPLLRPRSRLALRRRPRPTFLRR